MKEMVELFLAVKVYEEDKRYVHFCFHLRPVPERQTWMDFIGELRDAHILGDEFVLMELEVMPTMKCLCPRSTYVEKGSYRLCFQHQSM